MRVPEEADFLRDNVLVPQSFIFLCTMNQIFVSWICIAFFPIIIILLMKIQRQVLINCE